MPSSNKTAHLGLNKWLGSDKPQKDDFVSDNQKIDNACKAMSDSAAIAAQSLSTHSGNITAHVTAAEREAWNSKDKLIVGTYKGDNAASRKINLGFAPKFGILYAMGQSPERHEWDFGNCNLYSGYFGAAGSVLGIATDSTGFTVSNHLNARPDGHTLKYNDSAYTYIYVVWPG